MIRNKILKEEKMSLQDEIKKLKEEKKAIILAHNYQLPEIQDIADYLGDSLALSRKAAETDAEVIVFCGVHFMAETAAILSPQKTVLIPDKEAGCPMAEMVTAEDVKKLKEKHPNAKVVCYVNTSAAVKAESDICCTSANAVEVVESLKDESEIIFIPDKNLAAYASKKTGKQLIIWEGYCPLHADIKPADVLEQKKIHPEAKVIAHPECTPETIELADSVQSTGGMLKYVKESNAQGFIVCTDSGMIYRLEKENPGKKFYPATKNMICPDMKITTLEKVKNALEKTQYIVKIPEDIRIRAKSSLDRMLEI